jgi:hypothetical protein
MSLSVSSFPEAPPKVERHPKWQETLSLKSGGKFFGTFLNKRPVPFLKGIGHLAKAHVKGSIVHLRVNVPRCRSQHPSSLSKSSAIQSSSIVIDIFPIPDCDECCLTDADVSSLDPTIELSSSSRSFSPAAPSTPSSENAAISMADSVEAPHRSSQYSDSSRDPANTDEEYVQPPAKEHEEAASAVCDSEPHDSQPSDSDATITLPISRPLTTQPLVTPSMIPRVRSHSVSPGVKTSPTETIPSTQRPRYKSETAVGSRRRTASSSPDDFSSSSSERKEGRGKTSTSVVPPLPSSPHNSSIAQKREIRSKRYRSGASNKSMGGSSSSNSTKAAEFQITANHRLRPKMVTSDDASTIRARSRSRSCSPSMVVSPSDGAPQPPPLPLPPNSLDRGTWMRLVALPHTESGIPVRGSGEQQQHRPRAASDVLTTS